MLIRLNYCADYIISELQIDDEWDILSEMCFLQSYQQKVNHIFNVDQAITSVRMDNLRNLIINYCADTGSDLNLRYILSSIPGGLNTALQDHECLEMPVWERIVRNRLGLTEGQCISREEYPQAKQVQGVARGTSVAYHCVSFRRSGQNHGAEKSGRTLRCPVGAKIDHCASFGPWANIWTNRHQSLQKCDFLTSHSILNIMAVARVYLHHIARDIFPGRVR